MAVLAHLQVLAKCMLLVPRSVVDAVTALAVAAAAATTTGKPSSANQQVRVARSVVQ